MKFLRGEQRESRPGRTQIETGLRAEDRSCSRASAIGAPLTFLKHQPEKIMILAHAGNYPALGAMTFAKTKKFLDWTVSAKGALSTQPGATP